MPAQPLVCGGDEMTDWGEGPRRSTRQKGSNSLRGDRPPDQMREAVRGLRIACRTIAVSLKDTGPRVGRLDRKRRVTS